MGALCILLGTWVAPLFSWHSINQFLCLPIKKKKKKQREREKKQKASKKERKTAKEEKLAKYSLFVSSWNDVQCAYLLISLI